MNKNKTLMMIAVVFISLTVLMNSCGDEKKPEGPTNLTVYCDNAVFPILEPMLMAYDSAVKEINFTFIDTTAFACMSLLLTGDAQTVILSRDYSLEEKNELAYRNIKLKKNRPYAYDMLVFFTKKETKLDTLNSKQIFNLLTLDEKLSEQFPELGSEPVFAIKDVKSSEFENLRRLVADNKKIIRPLKAFATIEEVKKFVSENENAIGIAYWTQIADDESFKCLGIGFTDTTGKYHRPEIVHPSTLVRGLYPYKVSHFIYLQDQSRSAAKKLFRYMIENNNSAFNFNELGFVPAFTKHFKLIEQ